MHGYVVIILCSIVAFGFVHMDEEAKTGGIDRMPVGFTNAPCCVCILLLRCTLWLARAQAANYARSAALLVLLCFLFSSSGRCC